MEQERLVRRSSTLQVSNVAVLLGSLVQSVIASQYLGVSAFGLISLVLTTVALVSQFADARAWELIANHGSACLASRRPEPARAIVHLSVLVALACGVVTAVGSIALGLYLSVSVWMEPGLRPFVVLYALAGSWSGVVQNAQALLRALDRFRLLALFRVASAAVTVTAVAWAAAADSGVVGMFVAYSIAAFVPVVGGAVLIAVMQPASGNSPGALVSLMKERGGEFRRFLMQSWVTGTLQTVALQADEFILGLFAVPAAVGRYRITKNLGRLALSMADGVGDAIYPQLAELWARGRRDDVRRIVSLVLGGGGVAVALVYVASLFTLPPFVAIVFGAEFRPSVLLVALVMLNVAYIPFIWSGALFRVSGHMRVALRIEVIAAAIALAAFFLLVPRYGSYGAAVGFSAHSVVYSMIAATYFWLHKRQFFGTHAVR